MAIVTKRTVKEYLLITVDTYDSLIDQFIPQVEEDFRIIRNKDFDIDSNDDIDYPDNAELISAQMVGYLLKTTAFTTDTYGNKKSESIGSYSYTNNGKEEMKNGYPKIIVGRIERKVSTR